MHMNSRSKSNSSVSKNKQSLERNNLAGIVILGEQQIEERKVNRNHGSSRRQREGVPNKKQE